MKTWCYSPSTWSSVVEQPGWAPDVWAPLSLKPSAWERHCKWDAARAGVYSGPHLGCLCAKGIAQNPFRFLYKYGNVIILVVLRFLKASSSLCVHVFKTHRKIRDLTDTRLVLSVLDQGFSTCMKIKLSRVSLMIYFWILQACLPGQY